MVSIKLNVKDDLAHAMRQLNQPLPDAALEAIVLELYRRRILTSGKAGPMLGMKRFEFVKYASRLGIAFFDMDADEWKAEMELIKKI